MSIKCVVIIFCLRYHTSVVSLSRRLRQLKLFLSELLQFSLNLQAFEFSSWGSYLLLSYKNYTSFISLSRRLRQLRLLLSELLQSSLNWQASEFSSWGSYLLLSYKIYTSFISLSRRLGSGASLLSKFISVSNLADSKGVSRIKIITSRHNLLAVENSCHRLLSCTNSVLR